jgi:hypothetical protein
VAPLNACVVTAVAAADRESDVLLPHTPSAAAAVVIEDAIVVAAAAHEFVAEEKFPT